MHDRQSTQHHDAWQVQAGVWQLNIACGKAHVAYRLSGASHSDQVQEQWRPPQISVGKKCYAWFCSRPHCMTLPLLPACSRGCACALLQCVI